MREFIAYYRLLCVPCALCLVLWKNKYSFFNLLLVFFTKHKAQSTKHLLAATFLLFCTPPAYADIFSGNDALKLVNEAIATQEKKTDVSVLLVGLRPEDVIANTAGMLTGEIDSLELERQSGRWQALLLLKENGKSLAPLRISGSYDEMVEIPTLKRMMKSGEVIYQDDIQMQKQPFKRLRKNTITEITEVIGKSPKRVISADRPIRSEEISSPLLVKRGTRVTLWFKTPTIEMKTVAEAMDNGAKGDVIRVKNLNSKQVVDAKVESAESVSVTSPDSEHAFAGR